jgi:hypothetical protein
LLMHHVGFEWFFGLMNDAVSFVRFAFWRGCEMLGFQFERPGDAEFCFLALHLWLFFRLETARTTAIEIHLSPCRALAVA